MIEFKKHINIQNPKINNCCGCSACMQSCPKDCISMVEDNEGFLYPKVDESKCIDCGICSKSCSWLKELQQHADNYPQVYAVKNRSDEVRLRSTSGGMFSALAEFVISKGGIVYGASFNPNNKRVEYIGVEFVSKLDQIRGSKYVQCYVGDTYSKIKEQLQKDRVVLFSGTPCHCSGLTDFLKKRYDNLYIVDILCHSTPSPKVFKDLLKKNEEVLSEPVSQIRFRDKTKGWRSSYHCVISSQSKSVDNETYLTLFFKGLINRPSCYNCRYTSHFRPTDLTMGDYWNINSVDSNFEDKLGVSCVLINNRHGHDLFNFVSDGLVVLKTPLEPSIQDCMKQKTGRPVGRTQFWNDYHEFGFNYCEQKYGVTTFWDKIRHNIISKAISIIGLDKLKRSLMDILMEGGKLDV